MTRTRRVAGQLSLSKSGGAAPQFRGPSLYYTTWPLFWQLFVAIARLSPFEIRPSLFGVLLFRHDMWQMIRLV
jgi:hypothetical protein